MSSSAKAMAVLRLHARQRTVVVELDAVILVVEKELELPTM